MNAPPTVISYGKVLTGADAIPIIIETLTGMIGDLVERWSEGELVDTEIHALNEAIAALGGSRVDVNLSDPPLPDGQEERPY